jgi:hypothetical protein
LPSIGLRLLLIAAAIAVALVPIPAGLVERLYSTALYPPLQAFVTRTSNLVPFALLDALIVVIVLWLLWRCVRDLRGRARWGSVLGRWLLRLASLTAVVYLAFVLVWGLNYRRPPLSQRLARTTAWADDSVKQLAREAVAEVNRRYAAAHAAGAFDPHAIDGPLASAFRDTLRLLGLPDRTVPGRPKRTLLDPYYRAAAVAGMTDPFFLETLVVSDLLPIERPLVIAHEWSHLAGINDEGDANFVAWLTGVRSSDAGRYSAWLFMYGEALSSMPRAERAEIAGQLGPGPREDLRAIEARQRRNVRPVIADAGWQVYDRYLKANRIEAGAASYRHVVRLAVETRFGPNWTPVLAR